MTMLYEKTASNKIYIVMGVCETGEHLRYSDIDFKSENAAYTWIVEQEWNYPESSLYVEAYTDHLCGWTEIECD
jgi:hypothetical protein